MASVVAGGLFNAVAFAGAGYVFHKLDKKGYEDKMKLHNLAVEQLQAAKEKWYEKTVDKENKIALLRISIVIFNSRSHIRNRFCRIILYHRIFNELMEYLLRL